MPEKVLDRIIRACSNPGETVLDPFGGSGTTLVVAKKRDRRFIGFELSKDYADRIQARLKSTSAGDPITDASVTSKMKAPPTAMGKRRKQPAQEPTLIPFPTQVIAPDQSRAIG
jgi:site-specific DNA-methyltransferase (adenine-specific)